MSKKPTEPRSMLNSSHTPNTIEVHDYGRYPSTLVRTIEAATGVDLKVIAPNGRIYSIRLVGNNLHVSALEGGLWVRPKADNLIVVANLTPFERAAEEAIEG